MAEPLGRLFGRREGRALDLGACGSDKEKQGILLGGRRCSDHHLCPCAEPKFTRLIKADLQLEGLRYLGFEYHLTLINRERLWQVGSDPLWIERFLRYQPVL